MRIEMQLFSTQHTFRDALNTIKAMVAIDIQCTVFSTREISQLQQFENYNISQNSVLVYRTEDFSIILLLTEQNSTFEIRIIEF